MKLHRVLLMIVVLLVIPLASISAQGGGVCGLTEACTACHVDFYDENGYIDVYLSGVCSARCQPIYDSCFAEPECTNTCEFVFDTCATNCTGGDCELQCELAYHHCVRDYFGCPAGNCGFEDARLDQFSCAAPVALFCDGHDIVVYDLLNGSDSSLMTVPLPDGDAPAENTLLAEAGGVAVYQLSTGEYQVNVFDGEGNPYVLVWDGCPAGNIYQIK